MYRYWHVEVHFETDCNIFRQAAMHIAVFLSCSFLVERKEEKKGHIWIAFFQVLTRNTSQVKSRSVFFFSSFLCVLLFRQAYNSIMLKKGERKNAKKQHVEKMAMTKIPIYFVRVRIFLVYRVRTLEFSCASTRHMQKNGKTWHCDMWR